jgi:hypothetical protein
MLKKGGAMKFIDEIDLKGKKVLFRFDYNVPLDSTLNITDDIRIRATLPTINYALDEGAIWDDPKERFLLSLVLPRWRKGYLASLIKR